MFGHKPLTLTRLHECRIARRLSSDKCIVVNDQPGYVACCTIVDECGMLHLVIESWTILSTGIRPTRLPRSWRRVGAICQQVQHLQDIVALLVVTQQLLLQATDMLA
eukprot:gnl/TRDRNA2_/TRDRNA2_115202_c1_seq1.p1 gnl/TRDRNA2_/TRDRNA2_115202_c1~~gnl/TRDRNA2_/TRDRNA2_115202_c1_seq1.p1  ORF type:complete len:107 (+),score=12.28 gnl/TRDRNA2_/TRDRNA2_115202_c1_seq1:35-355(+)